MPARPQQRWPGRTPAGKVAPAVPLHWKIDPQQRLATATAEGDVTRAEVEAFIEALRVDGGYGFRKLFDGVRGTIAMDADDLLALGVRARAAHAEGPIGPLAVVVSDEQFEKAARVLGMLASADRPMRVFATVAAARKWIDGLPR